MRLRSTLKLAIILLFVFPFQGQAKDSSILSRCRSLLSLYVEYEVGGGVILSGTKVLFSPYGFDRDVSVTTFKPSTGVGNLLEVHSGLYGLGAMSGAVRKLPTFFKKYDIHQSPLGLVIPDTQRLNSLLPAGMFQFVDQSFWGRQYYKEDYFRRAFLRGFVPLAVRGEAFRHDRTAEHLMGALIIRPWLYRLLQNYAAFEEIWMRSPAMLKNYRYFVGKDPSAHLSYTVPRFMSVSVAWDILTSELGNYISNVNDSNRRLNINNLEDIFKKWIKQLDPSELSAQMRSLMGHYAMEDFDQFLMEVDQLAAGFPKFQVDDQFIKVEVVRIYDELTETN